MKRKKNIKYLLTALLFVFCAGVKAQSRPAASDTSDLKVARLLSVSPEKAKQIRAVFNFRHEEFQRLMLNTSLKPAEKDKQLKALFAERRRLIDSVLTPDQKRMLFQSVADLKAKQTEKFNSARQNNKTEMNKVPHTTKVVQQ